MYVSIYLSIYPSIHPSIHPSIRQTYPAKLGQQDRGSSVPTQVAIRTACWRVPGVKVS